MASSPARAWTLQGRPVVAARMMDVNLALDGTLGQLWEGFGGGVSEMGWEALFRLKGVERQRVLQALFNAGEGCNFHYARTPIGASNLALQTGSYNDTAGDFLMRTFSVGRDRAGILPFLRHPLERIRKFKVVAAPWSPPEWMKEPDRGGLVWTPQVLDAYALYLVRFLEAYRREGVEVDHLLVQNAPLAGHRRPGCRWTGAQLRDFIRNHLGPCLGRARLTTHLWLGAFDTPDYEECIVPVMSDPMAAPFLYGVACQHQAQAMLPRLAKTYPGLKCMLSDCGSGTGANSWSDGHRTFAEILAAIQAGASVCLYENMVFPAGGCDMEGRGRNSLVAVGGAGAGYTLTPDYHAFRHLSCLVDRYAVRLGLKGEWAPRALAFLNDETDESRVLILHNPEEVGRRIVVEDRGRRFVLLLPALSFNTVVL